MVGSTISRYRIIEKLGAGGMGVVYKAEDISLARLVAIKVLSPAALDSPEAERRFRREAQAAARIHHPNICPIYEIGEGPSGPFLAMAFLEGQTVQQMVAERPLKINDCLDISIQACEGLKAAHENGVVHRDIKSANLMVTTSGQVQILDFGLARLSGMSRVTQADSVIGTPAYMSPEQAKRIEADRRADIWSIGVVIYEMATGKLPFEGEHDQAVLFGITSSDYEPITALRVGIPTELDRIVAKALQKDRSLRYQHVDDLLVDLRCLFEDIKSGSPEFGGSRALPKQARSRRAALAIVSAGFLVAAAASTLYLLGPASAVDSLAVLPFTIDSDDNSDYLGEGLAEGLIINLARAEGLRVISRDSAFRYQGDAPEARAIGQELGVGAVLKGRIARQNSGLVVTAELVSAEDASVLWSGRFQRAEDSLLNLDREIAASIAERIDLVLPGGMVFEPVAPATENPEAHRLYLLGRYNWSRRGEYLIPARDYFQQAIDLDPSYALGWAGLADSYLMLGGWSVLPPGDSYPRARAAAERAIELDPSLAEPYATLGYYEMIYGRDWENGRLSFEQALSNNPNYATAHHWFAYYFVTVNDPLRAIQEIQSALALDPLSPVINRETTGFLVHARQYEEAEAAARRALELTGSSGGGYGYGPLSLCYALQGRFPEARSALEQAISGRGLPAFTWYNAGIVFGLLNDEPGTRRALTEIETLARETYVSPQLLGGLYAMLGENDRAFELFQAAIDDRSFIASWMRRPVFDEFARDPRFAALMGSIGLDP